MSKYFALIIYSNGSFKRVWLNNSQVKEILYYDDKKVKNVYRISNDQVAHIINDELMWEDVASSDFGKE